MSVLDTVRSNMRFRMDSLKSLVMGTNDVSQSKPLKRRQAIIRRRRDALKGVTQSIGIGSGGADVSATTGATSGTVESVDGGRSSVVTEDTTQTETVENVDTMSTEADIPSMSEANRGTAKRAKERGYGS